MMEKADEYLQHRLWYHFSWQCGFVHGFDHRHLFCSCRLLFEKQNIVIMMLDAVPQSLAGSFSPLIPLLVNIIVWYGINTLVTRMSSVTLPMAISNVLAMPLHALTSIPGMNLTVPIQYVKLKKMFLLLFSAFTLCYNWKHKNIKKY